MWQRPFAAGHAATDSDGNVYVLGATYTGELITTSVAKLSNAGTLQWTRQIGTPHLVFASDIATDSEGNVYISGSTESSLGSADGVDNDAWLVSYSASGALRWKRKLATEGNDSAAAISADANGNVYICGWTYNEEDAVGEAWLAKYYTRR